MRGLAILGLVISFATGAVVGWANSQVADYVDKCGECSSSLPGTSASCGQCTGQISLKIGCTQCCNSNNECDQKDGPGVGNDPPSQPG